MLITVAGFYLRQGDAAAAETAARAAIEIAAAALPADNPVSAAGCHCLAAALSAQRKTAEATVYAVQAVTMLKRCEPDGDALAYASIDLAELQIESGGELAEAVDLLRQGSLQIDWRLRRNLELIPAGERLALTLTDRFRLDLWMSLVR